MAALAVAASPAVAAAGPDGMLVPICGNHAPVRVPLPARGKSEMPQGCHAGCMALAEKKKRLASG